MDARNVELMKKMQYMLNMRPPLNRNALFSDGTENYRKPSEPLPGEQKWEARSHGPEKEIVEFGLKGRSRAFCCKSAH